MHGSETYCLTGFAVVSSHGIASSSRYVVLSTQALDGFSEKLIKWPPCLSPLSTVKRKNQTWGKHGAVTLARMC